MGKMTSPESFDADLVSEIVDGLIEIADDEGLLEEGAEVRVSLESDE